MTDRDLFLKKWNNFSLARQIANIGSEFNRALYWREKNDEENKEKSFERILELIDLTLNDKRWKSRISEILKLREAVCDLFTENNEYNIFPDSLKNYFLHFGLRANI